MRLLEPAEPLRGRSWTAWALDTMVAVVSGVAVLPYLEHHNRQPPSLAIVLPVVIVVLAPMVVRRVYPLAVLAWLLAATVGTALWNHRLIPGLALLVALYTVAATCSRREALLAAGALEAGVIGAAVRISGTEFWYDAIFLSGLVGAALGLGLYSGTRRAYLAELRGRADRLERERDQQGALAAAAERSRIAREMHDVVAHHLTVMVALSEGAVAASATSPARGVEVMRTVSATGRRALADTRRLLGVLRDNGDPETVDVLAPVPDLAELEPLLERVRAAGLPVRFEIRGAAVQVPDSISLTAYRVAQEALTNTLKHAGGARTRATVRLQYLPGQLRVDVRDDGDGSADRTTSRDGTGLTGMRERVKACGGQLSAGPGRAGGWQVSARLPLDDSPLGESVSR